MSDPSLKARLAAEIPEALKGGDRIRLGALRMLSAAVTNREKEVGHELSDDELREVASREVKKRGESIQAFEGAGRRELADRERAERDAISAYAPEQLRDEEIGAMIDEAIAATGATEEKDVGKVMGSVMGKARGRVDGAVVQRLVRDRLGSSG